MRWFTLFISIFLAACGQPYKARKNLSYGNHAEMTFDFYEPPFDVGDDRPLIIAIHGGAWQSGDKIWGEQIAKRFCWRGYCVASINYRLAPTSQWPAQIEDCQAALRYFRGAAWMKIDPDRIASFGHSAGGHLASMLALRGPDRVSVFVSASGEGDLVNNRDQDQNLELLLGDGPWNLQDVSPTYFARQDVSGFLIHATGDTNVSYQHSVDLQGSLLMVGADIGLYTVFNADHNRAWQDEHGFSRIVDFLKNRLNPRSSSTKAEIFEIQEKLD